MGNSYKFKGKGNAVDWADPGPRYKVRVITSFLSVRKLRLRESKHLSQGYSGESNQGRLRSKRQSTPQDLYLPHPSLGGPWSLTLDLQGTFLIWCWG